MLASFAYQRFYAAALKQAPQAQKQPQA
jgi:hypothetical protein